MALEADQERSASIQTEAFRRRLAKSMRQRKNCIDPSGGFPPEVDKIDAPQ